MKKYALIVPFALSTSLAVAAEQPYIGVDYFGVSFSQSDFDMNSYGVRLKLGSEINQYFAAEIHIATAAEETLETDDGDEWDVKLEYLYGMGFRGQFPFANERARFYGTVGYSYARLEAESDFFDPEADSVDGASIGFGFDVTAAQNWLVNIDYTSYINSNSAELTGASVGVRYQLQ
ncbi:MAG: hypothetical protein COB51_01535 [Moraxellaceae bacterium]|nr:MAG: hypothetical protein COB51_01535 [Moraxellaceae bacterium]